MSMPTNTNSRTPNQEKIRVGLRDRLPTTKLGGPHFYWICLFALVGYPRRFDSHGCGLPWCGAERVPPLSISCCTKKKQEEGEEKSRPIRGHYRPHNGRQVRPGPPWFIAWPSPLEQCNSLDCFEPGWQIVYDAKYLYDTKKKTGRSRWKAATHTSTECGRSRAGSILKKKEREHGRMNSWTHSRIFLVSANEKKKKERKKRFDSDQFGVHAHFEKKGAFKSKKIGFSK